MAASPSNPAAREIPALERTLEDLERRLGPDHEDVGILLNDLGGALEECGRYAEAGRAYARALAIIEATSGPGHPDTANILNNIANVRHTEGDSAAAEGLFRRALSITDSVLEDARAKSGLLLDPDTEAAIERIRRNALSGLGHALRVQGRYAEAEPALERALALAEESLRPEDPDVAAALNALGMFYKYSGKYDRAEPLYLMPGAEVRRGGALPALARHPGGDHGPRAPRPRARRGTTGGPPGEGRARMRLRSTVAPSPGAKARSTTRGLRAVSARLVLLATLGCSEPEAPPTVSPVAVSGAVEVLAFDRVPDTGTLPRGWEPYSFRSIDRPTLYTAGFEEGRLVLRGNSRAAASALRRRISIDPRRYPRIEWSWNVSGSIPGADCTRRETDDCAARILLLYRFEPERASLQERLEFEAARADRGEYPPSAILVYAWVSPTAPADPFPSPLSDRIRMIPVERGDARAGTWVTERRDHLADYKEAFGETPPPIDSVAFMVDTDDTGEQATAWLESLRFLPQARR